MRRADDEIVYLGHRNVLIVLAALAGLAFAFERADTYVTLGVFAAVLLLLVARAPSWKVVLGALLMMVAVWVMFRLALGVRLPAGDFWDAFTDLITSKPGDRL
jgi:hypothetical protein